MIKIIGSFDSKHANGKRFMRFDLRILALLRPFCTSLAFTFVIATLSTGANQRAVAQDLNTATVEPQNPPMRWWKGNLHTHSLWSDGNDFPEMIADWYADNDYHFLALSDHNILSDGVRYMKLADIAKRSKADVLAKYRKRFGSDWVEVRGSGDEMEVRLKPLDEFAPLLQQAGQFLMIPGEEISDSAEGKPIHMNATNLKELIQPLGGSTVQEVMRNNLRSVIEQEKETGRQILPHLNHPNFGYAVTAEDLAAVVQERFFEVYNGHPSVNQEGDDEHLSIEKMWDVANAIRVLKLDADPLMGVATDDSHNYHSEQGATTGRGWVMVRAAYLTPEHLIKSLKAGDFYASSGVTLSEISFDPDSRTLRIEIKGDEDEQFETEFVSIRETASEQSEWGNDENIGRVEETVSGSSPTFTCPEEVRVIRARITCSAPHENPSLPNQRKQAWTQPIVLGLQY